MSISSTHAFGQRRHGVICAGSTHRLSSKQLFGWDCGEHVMLGMSDAELATLQREEVI